MENSQDFRRKVSCKNPSHTDHTIYRILWLYPPELLSISATVFTSYSLLTWKLQETTRNRNGDLNKSTVATVGLLDELCWARNARCNSLVSVAKYLSNFTTDSCVIQPMASYGLTIVPQINSTTWPHFPRACRTSHGHHGLDIALLPAFFMCSHT
jgi:hypothetical protein